jgi:hypothetical protein
MNDKNLTLLVLLFLSLNVFSQKNETGKTATIETKNIFETINPNENDRPNQFLTNFLRTDKRFRLDGRIKAILSNPNLYGDSQNSLRDKEMSGNGTTSLTRVFFDNVQIFGEGINRIFVIEKTQTKDIDKITRSSVGYDTKIHIYSKK